MSAFNMRRIPVKPMSWVLIYVPHFSSERNVSQPSELTVLKVTIRDLMVELKLA